MRKIPPRSRARCWPRCAPATWSWSKARSARAWAPSSRRCSAPIRCIRRPTTILCKAPRRTGDAMLYWLIELSGRLSVFNVFRYITFRTGGAIITALLFVFLFGPAIIDRLRLLQGKGQPIRPDGPKSHIIAKAGTPTMGGLMILSGMLVSTLLWANPSNPYVWIVLGVTIAFGLIGFYDDYLKVSKQSHDGFGGRSRLALEFIVAAIACYFLVRLGQVQISM